MRMWLLILAIQVGLVVHVLKTDRSKWWIAFILLAPLVGSLVYIIVEIMPDYIRIKPAADYNRLVDLCGGSWDRADRLIRVEHEKRPQDSRDQCIANAVYQLQRDRQ